VTRQQLSSMSGLGNQATMRNVVANAQRANDRHSDRVTMLAWERFLAGEPSTSAPSALIDSWQRSLQSGVSPTAGAAPVAVHGDAVATLCWRHRELLAAADRLFTVTADLFADSHSILLLTNQDGVILKAAGDLRTLAATASAPRSPPASPPISTAPSTSVKESSRGVAQRRRFANPAPARFSACSTFPGPLPLIRSITLR
jgi:hypothetical protein